LEEPFFLTQKDAQHMIENISSVANKNINILSISATSTSITSSKYCLSKVSLLVMTKVIATKLGKYNILVYEIQPVIIRT
jgi:3-oxoacyl-[acyl-carrier protein] reductase